MKEILFALPALGDNCGVLATSYESLAEEMSGRGWAVQILDARHPDFLPKVLSFGQNDEAILFLGHFFYDLRISAQNHFQNTNIADLVRCPIGIKLGDHPFTRFMWERIFNMHERTFVFSTEPGYLEAAQFLQPKLGNYHSIDPPISYARRSDPISFEDRAIDLLVPMTMSLESPISTILQNIQSGSDSRRLAEATYESLRDNRTEYPLTVFRRLLRELFSRDLPNIHENKDFLLGAFGILSDVEHCIRAERRIDFLSHLLGDINDLNVMLIDRGLPDCFKNKNVNIRPPVDAKTLGKLMGMSKMVAHCHPTFPNGLHERIINGMASQSVVISDYAPVLENKFHRNKELIWTDEPKSFVELIEEIGKDNLPLIAKNAYERAWMEFSPGNHMDIILDAMAMSSGSVS